MANRNEPDTPRLGGVFAPLVTPFSDGALDLDALQYNLQRLAGTPLAGYVVLGSNGEFRSLSEHEREQVLRACADHRGDKTVIVGASAESTPQVLAELERVHALGFGFAAVQAPSYFAKSMSQPVIQRFFTEIADRSPLPLVLYNAPGFLNGVTISPATMAGLARHPRIVGVKDSGSSGPFAYIAACEESAQQFSVLAGSATYLYPGLHAGARGGVVSLANVIPELCHSLYELFMTGQYGQAATMHNRIVRLNSAVSGSFAVAGVKAAMSLCGYRGGEPRPPLAALGQSEVESIRRCLQQEGVL